MAPRARGMDRSSASGCRLTTWPRSAGSRCSPTAPSIIPSLLKTKVSVPGRLSTLCFIAGLDGGKICEQSVSVARQESWHSQDLETIVILCSSPRLDSYNARNSQLTRQGYADGKLLHLCQFCNLNLEFDIVCLEIERKEPICLFTMLNWLFCFCHLMF